MKKKRILGIMTAMLMVIALALTGCGQKSEQNAGAAGSEYGNGASVSEPSKESIDEPVVDDEPVMDIGEKPDGSDVVKLRHWYHDRDEAYIKTVKKDGSGYYHYNVGDKELLCKTNVWDFIEAKEGLRGTYYVWHFEDMARAIGLFPSDYEADYTMSAKTNPDNERWDFTLNCGEAFENPYGQTVVQYVGESAYLKNDEAIYRISSVTRWAVSLEQISFAAYEMEQLQLGRSDTQIMEEDFAEWKGAGNNYIIP